MRIAILGAGAIGTLFAARIAQQEEVEIFIHSRGEQFLTLDQIGLQLDSATDSSNVEPNRWTLSNDEMLVPTKWFHSTDVCFICTKSSDTEHMAMLAADLLKPDGFAISLQNGLGNEEKLQQILGYGRTLGAITTHGARKNGPGHTTWTGVGEVVIGHYAEDVKSRSTVLVDGLQRILQQTGLNPRWSNEIRSEIWQKLLINCAINPIAAICGVENGALLKIDSLRKQSQLVLLEAANVGRAHGVNIPTDEELLARLEMILSITETNECSMLQDLKAGRRTEIDAINKEVVRLGISLGLECSLNSMLVATVEGIENSMHN